MLVFWFRMYSVEMNVELDNFVYCVQSDGSAVGIGVLSLVVELNVGLFFATRPVFVPLHHESRVHVLLCKPTHHNAKPTNTLTM